MSNPELSKVRAGILAHFDRHDVVDPYVFFFARELKKVCKDLIFVSTSKISPEQRAQLEQFCTKVVERPDEGYDFMSWSIAIRSLELEKYDELVICNDSCYGPMWPLQEYFDKMADVDCDFWGFTEGTLGQRHLQPYFAVFRKPLLQSNAFKEFWSSIKVLHRKWDIIRNYEIRMTPFFESYGFKSASYFRVGFGTLDRVIALYYLRLGVTMVSKAILLPFTFWFNMDKFKSTKILREYFHSCLYPNITHFFWKSLLSNRMPFVKIELLRDNPTGRKIGDFPDYLRGSGSGYDLNLYRGHLVRMKATKKIKSLDGGT